jgi:UDP-2,3-diacylglucosamine pyrophosphatase LpxH
MDILRRLPQNYNVRWSADRKVAVVLAVHFGMISLDEVKNRYALGIREFREWEKLVDDPAMRCPEHMQSDNVVALMRTGTGVELTKHTDAEAA